jgi:hypothetical protein
VRVQIIATQLSFPGDFLVRDGPIFQIRFFTLQPAVTMVPRAHSKIDFNVQDSDIAVKDIADYKINFQAAQATARASLVLPQQTASIRLLKSPLSSDDDGSSSSKQSCFSPYEMITATTDSISAATLPGESGILPVMPAILPTSSAFHHKETSSAAAAQTTGHLR